MKFQNLQQYFYVIQVNQVFYYNKYFCRSFMQLKPIPTQPNVAMNEQIASQKMNEAQYNYQYYQEYKRLYQTAYLLSLQLKHLNQSRDQLWSKLIRLEKKSEDFKDDIRGEPPEKKKRFRRTAQEIQRKYTCEVQKCQKCYGSEGSLQQHIKLKHPELYESKSRGNSQNKNEEDINYQDYDN